MNRPQTTTYETLQLQRQVLLAELERLELHLSVAGPLAEDEQATSVLTCRVASGLVGVALSAVREVTQVARFEPIVGAPPWHLGIFDLRGTPVPIIDLEARLSGRPRQLCLSDRVVLCDVDDSRVGLVVNRVSGVHSVHRESLIPYTETEAAPFVKGAFLRDGESVLLIGLHAALLADTIHTSRVTP